MERVAFLRCGPCGDGRCRPCGAHGARARWKRPPHDVRHPLAAYGHGDWNDALQPADPAMRERMCSAWTVTLHHQRLPTLARRCGGSAAEPARAGRARAEAVQRDFQRLLVVDGVLTGYALFGEEGPDQPAGARRAVETLSAAPERRDDRRALQPRWR